MAGKGGRLCVTEKAFWVAWWDRDPSSPSSSHLACVQLRAGAIGSHVASAPGAWLEAGSRYWGHLS